MSKWTDAALRRLMTYNDHPTIPTLRNTQEPDFQTNSNELRWTKMNYWRLPRTEKRKDKKTKTQKDRKTTIKKAIQRTQKASKRIQFNSVKVAEDLKHLCFFL